ncbi:hypothetical protein M8542_08220 [Amycolatopsis sp. OK19-0408]|uniref:C2H2-type domain-containing protein n=1 Tax=Amycolatopsis iheyensis TaxID=2945988 RepID=A0A9X2SJX5_9PSEU|nr:hypothetical protein [Amycolatopsis iheyensis]MCR6482800.1 hypothetical protein [Amycolatopsis iheyensis]
MIFITLSAEQARDPETEALGRDHVGYREGMTPAEMYHANHGTWVIGRNRRHERYVLFAFRGEVKLAVEIQRIETIIVRSEGDTRDDRCVIHGRILEPGHRVHDAYVGRPSPLGAGRNPVRYFDSPLDETHACRCGCGQQVAGADFLIGHDHTALHDRVRQIGTVADFLDWFDIVRGNRPVHEPADLNPSASTLR